MQGVIERHGHWFCSERCIAEFERRRQTDACAVAPQRRWWTDPWVWVPVSGLLLGTSGLWWSAAAEVSRIYVDYVQKVGVALLAGLVIGGVIDHFIPREYIIKLLSGPRKRVIARATLLGFLAASCSHGCLALSLELYRKGASTPAVIAFLLASPWASMSLTLILLSLFGLRGLLIVALALVVSFATGLMFQRLDRRGLIERNRAGSIVEQDFSIRRDLSRRARQYPWTARQLIMDLRGVIAGMLPLGRMVLGWVQLGLMLSAAIGAFVPHQAFMRYLGPSPLGLLLTLVIATVMEVCSEGTAPVAFELYRHTGALGNAFVFLMGGVITDYTELGAVWTTIGRRTVLWLLAIALPLVLGIGLVLNLWS